MNKVINTIVITIIITILFLTIPKKSNFPKEIIPYFNCRRITKYSLGYWDKMANPSHIVQPIT